MLGRFVVVFSGRVRSSNGWKTKKTYKNQARRPLISCGEVSGRGPFVHLFSFCAFFLVFHLSGCFSCFVFMLLFHVFFLLCFQCYVSFSVHFCFLFYFSCLGFIYYFSIVFIFVCFFFIFICFHVVFHLFTCCSLIFQFSCCT